MKKLLLIITILLYCVPAHADYHFAEAWNWKNSALEGVFIAEVAVDLGQTLYSSEKPNEYYEAVNPFLPRHPSKNQVWEACIIGAGLHALVSMALKPVYHIEIWDYKKDFYARTWWQGTTIILEGANITRNKAIGIGFAF